LKFSKAETGPQLTPPQRRPASAVLVKQFVVCQSRELIPDDWSSSEHLGWWVATQPTDGLPVIPITAACGSKVGWLIGYAVDDDDGVLGAELSVPADAGISNFTTAFEQRVYALGGRYVAVLLTQDDARVYLDSCGSLSAVYAERFQTVCSSTALLPEDGDGWENRELAAVLDIPRHDRWYPFGLTPRLDARRLLPNHYLDLESWKSVRHWPKQQTTTAVSNEDIATLIEHIGDSVENLLRHLTEAAPVKMSLTAGRETRMLLACSRPVKDRIEFFTNRHPDRAARMDCHIARKLARISGIEYRIVDWQQASNEELEQWLFRTGRCIAGRTWKAVRTARQNGLGIFDVTGHAGEVGRAAYWRKSDLSRSNPTVEDLVGRLHLPLDAQILDAGQQWLDALPYRDFPTVLDFLYLEQRVGCWATTQFYGHVAPTSHIVGFNHRRIIESFLRLPVEYRFSRAMHEAVIRSRWQELLDVPVNQFMGIWALVDRLGKPFREFLHQRPRLRKIIAFGRRHT